MDEIQIIDLCETYSAAGESIVNVFGKTESGVLKKLRIRNTPYTIKWAISDSISDGTIQSVYIRLSNHLSNYRFQCRRTGCACNANGLQYGIYREPCMREFKITSTPVVKWEIVYGNGFEVSEDKMRPSEANGSSNKRRFVVFYIAYPYMYNQVAKFLNKLPENRKVPAVYAGVYDCHKTAVNAFILEKKVSGFDWLQVPQLDSYDTPIDYSEVIKSPNQKRLHAPLTILSVDIETISLKYRDDETIESLYPIGLISCNVNGKFTSFMLKSPQVKEEMYNSEADYDTCMAHLNGKLAEKYQNQQIDEDQIDELLTQEELTNVVNQMKKKMEESNKNEFLSLQIPLGAIYYFENEAELLRAYFTFKKNCDCDIVTGYNSNYYDFPYISRRAKRLGVSCIDNVSRLDNEPMYFLSRDKVTNQAGTREQIIIDCPGRIYIDLYPICESQLKLNNYKLNTVARSFGLGGKTDVTEFYKYFHTSKESRLELLRYCIRDVDSVVSITARMGLIEKLVERSRIQRVRTRDTLDRGLAYVLSMMVRARIHGRYFMTYKFEDELRAACKTIPGYQDLYNKSKAGEQYDGAYVLDPLVGIRKGVVVTVDFNSLYPNTGITFNICPTTIVPPPSADTWYTEDDVHLTSAGFYFLKQHVKQGEITAVWDELLQRRKEVKQKIKDLKASKSTLTPEDRILLAMWSAEENELKVCANSLYGQLGARTSDLCMFPGAISITLTGQHYIKKTKKGLEECEEFKQHGLLIAYGDTDSLMIELTKIQDREKGTQVGIRIQDWINVDSKMLIGRLKIEFENCSFPTYFNAKKCYVKTLMDDKGVLYLKKSGLGKRDMTPYNAETLQTLLEMALLRQNTPQQLLTYLKKRCTRLLTRNVKDLSQLYHTAKISKHINDYCKKTPPIHIAAARMLVANNMDVRVGDRITYFKCMTGTYRSKNCEKGIPLELFDTGYALDMEAYVDEIYNVTLNKILAFLPGTTTEARLRVLKSAVMDNPSVVPVNYKRAKLDTSMNSGPMDKFVNVCTSNRAEIDLSIKYKNTACRTRGRQRSMQELFGESAITTMPSSTRVKRVIQEQEESKQEEGM